MQRGAGFFDKLFPELQVGVLVLGRRMVRDVLAGQIGFEARLSPRLLQLAHQCGSGFFGQDGFRRGTGGHADQQRQQRAVVTIAARHLVPGKGDRLLVVVHLAGNVFHPKIAAEQRRMVVFAVIGKQRPGGQRAVENLRQVGQHGLAHGLHHLPEFIGQVLRNREGQRLRAGAGGLLGLGVAARSGGLDRITTSDPTVPPPLPCLVQSVWHASRCSSDRGDQ